MVRLLHSGDWQVGKPFRRVDDDRRRFRLQQERLLVIERIDALGRAHKVQLALVAGDLFDSTTVPDDTVMEVLEAIGAMSCPVVVIPGNHDHGAPGSLWGRPAFEESRRRRAPNCQVLLQPEPLELDDALILPCPLRRQRESTDPTAWIAHLNWSKLPRHKPRVVLAHGGIQGFSVKDYAHGDTTHAGPGTLINLPALPIHEVDYVALGDWHNGRRVGSKAWYCGTPEPDRFDQGDKEHRGQVLIVDCERGQDPNVRLERTGRIGWHRIRAALHSDADVGRLREQIETIFASRVGRDLLKLEVSGCLGLEGHQQWQELINRLRTQLLLVRVNGTLGRIPRDEELAQLTKRSADPLIARVAGELAQMISDHGEAATVEEAEATAIQQLALCELHRLAEGQLLDHQSSLGPSMRRAS